jgi:hypothetical protein
MSDDDQSAWTHPELMRRIDALTDRLNALRNAVQGRGVDPIGSKALAAKVNAAQENWHDVRAQMLTGAAVMAHPFNSSSTIEKWEIALNGLIDAAAAEGIAGAPAKLDVVHTTTPGEALDSAEEFLADAGTFVRDLGILAAGIAGVWLITSMFPRGRA